MNIDMASKVGRVIAAARAFKGDAKREEKEIALDQQITVLLGDRLQYPDKLAQSKAAAEFDKFVSWCKAFGYRPLPAHPAAVAAYLMAVGSDTQSLMQVREAARQIPFFHDMCGHYLDAAYVGAALRWAKDCLAGASLL